MASPASGCIMNKPHVLMLAYPFPGHITPLMQLAKLLAARSFDVTFISTEANMGRMLNAKQQLMGSDLALQLGIRLVGIADSLPDTQILDCTCSAEAFMAALVVQRASFDELLRKMVQEQGVHITCIISDSFLPWTQDLADKWCIPRVSFWPQSLTAFACSFSIPNIMAAYPDVDPFKDEVYQSEAARVLNCIPGLPDFDARRLPFHMLGGEVVIEWQRQLHQEQMERVNEPLCIICNTFPDLEEEVLTHLNKLPLLSKPIFNLGPLLPAAFLGGTSDDEGTGSSMYDEDDECMQWLDCQGPHSVLYISLGSFALFDEGDALEIAMALEACNVPFLWVIRSSACELISSIQRPQGKIIQWAPQLKVLSHKAVGGFLTHCGWNSTLESVSLGVPIIGWPQMMDQITNCWFLVEKLKVGLQLEPDASGKIRRVGVEKAIRILMQEEEGEQMRVRAFDFSRSAQFAYTTSLPSHLDSFVQTILSSHASLSCCQNR